MKEDNSDGAHHLNRRRTRLGQQKVHLVQANPVLATAGALHAQGPFHQLLIEGLCRGPLLRVIGIDQIAKVEIAIPHMADQKVGNA